MNLPSPTIFGMPKQFTSWRENQDRACESITAEGERFLMQVCPTGFGKSINYMTAAHLIPGRTCILTSTKGLQTQLIHDFGEMETVEDIRGRNNYPCRLNTQRTCDTGLCVFGMKCAMKEEGGCFYYDQWKRALRAKVVVTNYAYFMSQTEFSMGLGKFNMLVLDEAHDALNHVINHTSVVFSKAFSLENRLLGLDGSLPNDANSWKDWAGDRLTEARVLLEESKSARKEKQYIHVKRLVEKLARMEDRMDRDWVWEDNELEVVLSPVNAARFTEEILFQDIPRVVLTSATVVPKTAELLGIDSDNLRCEEYPHSFPAENRPLTHVPTVQMNHKTTEVENRLWLTRVDQIIRDRLESKGVIHTISYARRDLIFEKSKYREHMITHKAKDAAQVVVGFKKAVPPCILVSPSMSTGWDFPDDECRWQIIIKLPYPDTRGKIIQAMAKNDVDFIPYMVMQQLIQATGRGCRNKEDWCETFIVDNNIVWFLDKYQHLTVEWFKGVYGVSRTVPKPIGGKN